MGFVATLAAVAGHPPDQPASIEPAETLARLVRGETLAEDETRGLFDLLLTGRLDDTRIGALLALLQARGPTVDELAGAARAMRARVTPVPYDASDDEALVDTCGTGGAAKTFNVSTAAAIVAAACEPEAGSGVGRVVVAKHGNRSRTGRGSAEVLEALGVNVDASPEVQAACLRDAGVCFCFAIRHHPAMRYAKGPRASLGFPTIFNLLGPLTNPAGATRQLIGVYAPHLVELVGRTLERLGAKAALVTHSDDGLDELSIGAASRTFELGPTGVSAADINPAALGLPPATPDQLRAETVEDAAGAIREVLSGEPGPRREIVRLNTAAGLRVAGAARSLEAGLELAAHAIDSGRAARTLAELARRSQG